MGAEERDRILNLLESGKISADQAAVLLEAVGGSGPSARAGATTSARPAPAKAVTPRPPAQLLRIVVDAQDPDGDENVKVNVNVPLGLARMAANFMPKEARDELKEQGIDLVQLIEGLGDELPDGPLVDIDATEGDGTKTVKVRIEVV